MNFLVYPWTSKRLTPLCTLIFLLLTSTLFAQLDNPDWGDNATPCVTDALLYPGVAVVTCAVVEEVPANGRFVMAYIAMNNSIPTSAPLRADITNPDSAVHHTDWLVSNIGNVFGTAINQSTAEVFVTASSNYGAGYGYINNTPAVLNYGVVGSPANDTEAAGTVYRIDPITGAVTVFARLPQQTVTFQHWDCEEDLLETTRSNTGVGLGNIVFDELNNQFFVSNTEDGRIYRLSNSGTILDSYDPLNYDTGAAGIDDLEDIPYGLAVEPGSNRLFFGVVDDPGAGPAGAQALPGAPSIYSIDLDSVGGFVGTVDTTTMPSGASYLNYVGTDQLHGSIPTSIPGGGFSYTQHTTYFISDLAFSPEGDLLVAVRTGCHGSWHSSYNHWAEMDVITLNIANNLYDNTPTEYDISEEGDAADEDGYGGVAVYELNDGSCDIHYLASFGDVLSEDGPHGIAIWDATTVSAPVSPLGVFEYGVLPNEDPKGVGGDVEVYNGCSNSCNIAGTTVACEADTVTLTYTPDCPNSAFTWQVTSGNATITGVNDSTVVTIVAGDENFTASVILTGNPSPCDHDVTVTTLQNPSITAAGPFCVDDSALNLSASPSGGTFSGTGITNASAGTFNPATAGAGTHTITYSLPGICMESTTINIVVNGLPTVSVSGGPFCEGESASNLTASPSGGTFSGTGITDSNAGTFDPGVAGVGIHTITYNYTDGNGCSNSAMTDITVYALPVVSVSGGPFCVDDAASNLTGTPAGGTFSGSGITDSNAGTFDPAVAGVGTHSITYDYTDGNGCSDRASTLVVVHALPVVSVSGGPFCIDDTASNLTASPSGGTFSGTGITDVNAGTFNPAVAGIGTHTITYAYTDGNGCSNTAMTDITVNALPVVNVSGGPFCLDDSASNLTASPSGGTFSGTGITDSNAGTFDPGVAGIGVHTITYSYTDGNGCSNSAMTDVTVFSLPMASISGGPFCIDDSPSNLTASPAGGTFSGPGITDSSAGTFDPAIAGAGNHEIIYVYIDGNGCSDSDTTNVIVNALPIVSISGGPFCIDDAASNLTASPVGGTFSGTGITDTNAGTFDPSVAGIGTHTITYDYTDANGCSNSSTTDISVNALPVASVSGGPFCVGELPSNLSASPVGGTFSGTGITDSNAGTFDPGVAGVGNHEVIYVYIDGNGCSDSDTTNVVVNALPTVSVSGGPFCLDDAPSNLIGVPAGGTFSGTGITDVNAGTFDPSVSGVGSFGITYNYTDANGCSDRASTTIIVHALPVVSLSGGPFCVDDAASDLTASPAGGTFSGTGITDSSAGTFDPAVAGVGVHTITYDYTDGNGCSNSTTTDITVNALPVVSVSGGPFCVDAGASNLTGTPAGGTFSGTGITDSSAGTFDPATAGVGVHTITYDYTDGNGCSNSATTDVTVFALPVVSVSGGPFCVDDAASNLTGSPAGGSFVGTGITDSSAGTFDPATAGVGVHTITYDYTDGNGCRNSATTDVTVYALPLLSLSGGPFCVDDAASDLTASPAGGTFSGAGITDSSAGTFDPAVAGVGVHTITYDYTDGNGCSNSTTTDVTVNALPVVSVSGGPFCVDAGASNLTGTPAGGTFSGTGITDSSAGTFDPATAGVGVHTITYDYTDGNGCSNSATTDVTVFALPVVSVSGGPFCVDDAASNLTGSPAGGSFVGTGITDSNAGTFDPALAGVGVHTITYDYTDGNGCRNSATTDVTVYALPVLSLSGGPFCVDDAASDLTASPAGGTFSGAGITDSSAGTFDPAVAGVGVHTITYDYTDGNGCSNSTTTDVTVNALPVVSVSGGPFCVDAGASNLTGTPAGGTFSGTGITDSSAGTFDPATAGVGVHTITYDYTDGNGCSNSATTDVTVFALPVVSVSGGPFCVDDAASNLTGSPAGGSFVGTGITDSSAGTFDPALAGVGVHTITYDYTDGNGCRNNATTDVTVYALPVLSLSGGPFCVDDAASDLTASPAGGTFSGTGITDSSAGTFDPAVAGVGVYTITYDYTDGNGCSNSTTTDITVNALPVVSVSGGPFCVDAGASNLTGTPAGGTFSGTGITDSSAGTFDPATAGVGVHTITYDYTDGNGCSNSATTDVTVFALPVVSVSGGPFCVDAGASNLTASPTGGIYSGPGITDSNAGTFDPAVAGVGVHTITYDYTDGNGCRNNATTDVTVYALPVLSLSGGPFCVDDAASNLTGTPSGGTFSGVGITDSSAGTFDPATAGVGVHTITYDYTDGNGCSNSTTTDITVNALPVVSVSGGPFCVDDAASNLTASPTGGIYSGPGITDSSAGTFDPATAGVGVHTITYDYTDGNGCSNSATTDVTVYALPVVSVSGGPFCVDDAASNLTGSPAGGSFVGIGITDSSAGTFDPALAGVGVHTITYDYTDGNGCRNNATTDVTVYALPVLSLSGGPFCVDDAASNLTGTPSGGTFSGVGITDSSAGTFDPATAGVGVHTITYDYTDGNGCSNSTTTDITVNALPVVSVSGGPFCVDDAASNLTASPTGGIYSGPGITDSNAGTFDPATAGVGVHTITYDYTDGNGCNNSATTDVTVYALPVVSVSGGPFCVDDAASNLTGSPAGGSFVGIGITDSNAGTFDPAVAGVGVHTITYDYTDGNGCRNNATTDVTVYALPVLSLSGGPFCVDDAASNLTGTPSGGTFSGVGITDSSAGTFDPATAGVGVHTITYDYTDGNGCSNSTTTDITVNALPVVSVSGGPFCVDDAASNLTASPTGGIYSGPGITNSSAGTFDPATAGVGVHTITYDYTDGNGCSNSATTDVTVYALPVVSVSGGPFCVDDAASNLIASPTGGVFSGPGITDSNAGTFDPATAGTGVHTITYDYTDGNGCSNSATTDVTVFALPVLSVSGGPFCLDDAPSDLTASPTGGVFSGPGIIDANAGTFDPGDAREGSHTITYEYTDGNGCTNSVTTDVVVNGLPKVSLSGTPYCVNDMPSALSGSPSGGTYSGTGITDTNTGTFDPAVAGVGTHTITYNYTDPNGCTDIATLDVEVFDIPIVNVFGGPFCIDDSPGNLIGNPSGGSFSGPGITDANAGTFNPATAGVGLHTITYDYTDGNGCSNSATTEVIVFDLPIVSLSGGPFCLNDAPSNLTGTPSGGTFSGTGITDASAGTFDPTTAGVGLHTITYEYTDVNGCSNSTTTDVEVYDLPELEIVGEIFCLDDLPSNISVSPTGGTFSGVGITDANMGTFDPSVAGVGVFTITYDYTDGNGCSNSATTDVTVNALPIVSVSGGPFCVDDVASDLTASPVGGTFSGTGITDVNAGTFDPSIAGAGVHTITYNYTDGNGCSNSASVDITVYALPIVSVSGGPFCVDDVASDLTASPAGGTFSGTGITDVNTGTFDPSIAGAGVHTITYNYTDGNDCSNSATVDITVNALPIVSVAGGPYCVDEAASNLIASPTGGIYSGPGITDSSAGTFDPATAGVGVHSITYDYTDGNGCSNSATVDITVNALPIVSAVGGPYCVDEAASNLIASPTGGIYSGPGITDSSAGTFDPSTAGVGIHTITYDYTDGNGCSNSATVDITVNALPLVSVSGGPFCIDEAASNLIASPTGGVFSGPGIIDPNAGTFDPSDAREGTHTITYEYTDGNGCTNIATTNVVVNGLPNVSLNGSNYCEDDLPSNLNGSPAGGTYSGTGITDSNAGTFDPATAGVGSHTITYEYTDGNGCTDNATFTIEVFALPVVSVSGGPFCVDESPSNLNGSPAGGTFSGDGIVDANTGTFDPSAAGEGLHTITYDYTDGNGCSNSATVDITVYALPVVSVSGGPFCVNEGLSLLVASPFGGLFSGSGVVDPLTGIFDPAVAGVGVHTITYDYTDGNGCSNSASTNVEVYALPDLEIVGEVFCLDDMASNISVTPSGGTFSGVGIIDVNAGTFDPSTAGVGTHTITYIYTDGNGCTNTTSVDITVNALPVVNVSGGPFCIDAAASDLTASPTGGVFSGPGITDVNAGTFDPGTAGVGVHTITYDYTDGNGCSNSATVDITVNALPIISVSGGPYCIDDAAENLLGSPAGGVFNGPGITDPIFGTFDPAVAGVGVHTISYDYTDGNGCSNSATVDITVNALPIVSVSGGPFCLDDTPSNLTATPTGGVYSGPGITDINAGTFNPATAGVGVHTITYDYTDGNGCSNSSTVDIEVFALPVVDVSGGPFCIDEAASNLTASPTGGVFSGPGITDSNSGTFDPATAGVGVHTISYDYTDGNGCSNSATVDITVNALPIVSVNGGPYCVDDAAENLLGTPAGGVFNGPGITDPILGTFDPAMAGVGVHTITYDYTDSNGCSNSATVDVTVNALPIVNVSGGPFCVDAAAIDLTASPLGGTFSGTGITDGNAGTFNPATAGVGVHTITYDYIDGNGCSNSSTVDIEVFALPVVDVSGGPFCIDDAASNLTASPTGGVFSGPGITDSNAGTFDPATAGVGVHTISYDYTDGNGCSNSATVDITVNALPIVSVSGGPYCVDDAAENLLGSPAGGVFNGPGITDPILGTFDPAMAGVGVHTITYDYTDSNGCSNSATVDVTVNALPIVNVSGGPFCVDATASDLTASPTGGVYSGPGITDVNAGTFDPATAGVGVHTITYDYTDGNGCSNSSTVDIEVFALPVVDVNGGPFCIDAAASNLTASPLGGTFSGTGIIDGNSGTFDPATAGVGVHTITYDYTDGNGCSNSATVDITVNALPIVSVNGGPYCVDDAAENLLGSPAGGVFNGTGIIDGNSGTFDPATAGVGVHTITYDYTDSNGCSNSATVDVTVNALPIVNVSGGPFCVDAAASDLIASPTGGVYSGPGITDSNAGTFDPATAGVGVHTIMYDYTDGNGCSNSSTVDIEVFALPVVDVNGGPFCIDDAVSNLTASPTGGVFSGPGIVDANGGTFDPATAGVGVHTITYNYTDSNGCSNSASTDVEVFALPVVTLSGGPFCIDDVPENLMASPFGGVFMGNGIIDPILGTFDPETAGVGVHTVTYEFTDGNGCSNTISIDVTVNALPLVGLSGGPFCVDDIPTDLIGTPAGGTFSGTGITDANTGTFDPSLAGVGTHTITYSFTDGNGCSNSETTDVIVNPLPTPSIDPVGIGGEVCIGNGLINLMPNPTGGIFGGVGIIDPITGIFDPKVAGFGTHTITYDYTDGNGCFASTTIDIEVINCFDLALTKEVDPMGSQGPFVLGETIDFIITVINQGQTDAFNVEVEDYIPSYMTFVSSPSFTLNGGSYTATIPMLAAGTSQELEITLELTSYANLDVINNAEIIFADDDMDDINAPPLDQDSDLAFIIGSVDDDTELVSDNDIDDEDPGQPGIADNPLDQDDYDPVLLPILDLANTKTVNAASLAAAGGTFEPNEIIVFEVNVFNQGNVTAENIVVTDTIPCGLSYENALNSTEGWALSGSGESSAYTIASLDPGSDTTILIHFSIKSSLDVLNDCTVSPSVVPGEPFTNFSFIKSAEVDGVIQTEDVDSEFDTFTIEEANTNPNEDGDDDTSSTGNDQTGSQDDSDPAIVEIFDLALSKIVNPLEVPYQVGDAVTFEICISNQGNVPSDSINIIDYIPAGLEYNTLSDGLGWSGSVGNSEATFAFESSDLPGGTLDFGEQVCTEIVLTVLHNQTDYINRSEITSATSLVDDGMGGTLRSEQFSDNDSEFDTTPADEAGGAAETESDALTNDILDPAVLGDGSGAAGDPNASTDDDSADPALVPIVDFALRKGLAESNITPYGVGDTVRFLIEVLNQGNVAGANIRLNDYIPSNLAFVDNATNAGWSGTPFGSSDATVNLTVTGPLNPGEIDSVYIDLEILAGGLDNEDYTNAAEIDMVFAATGAPSSIGDGTDITAFDIDSSPDSNPGNDNGSDASSADSPETPNPADDYVDGNGFDTTGAPDDGVQASDEDDADPALVAFHDVALTKTKSVDQGPVNIGDVVTFTITVYNQGSSPLDSVRIIDYVPEGFTFAPNNNWVPEGMNAVLTATVANGLIPAGGIPVGGSQAYWIELTVAPTATLDNLVNVAEITGSKDFNDLTQDDDYDSNPDSNPDNDPGGSDDTDSDDVIDGDGSGTPGDDVAETDEDDSDPEGVELALYSIGNQVWIDDNYDGLINGSEVGIDGVAVELYDADGNLVDMTVTADGGLYLFDTLLAGDYIVVIPAYELAPNGTLQDYESSTGTFSDGGIYETPGVDVETNFDNDDNGTFDTNIDYPGAVVSTFVTLGGDDEPLDEDPDNDLNTLDRFENLTIDFGFISRVYDVALIKQTSMPIGNSVGDNILFNITVTNQGNQALTNIEVTDYIADGYETVPALNDFITVAGGTGWMDNGSLTTYTIGDVLQPGESVIIPIYLELVSSVIPGAYVNYAEVSEFEDTIGNSTEGTGPFPGGISDEDSTPDSSNENDRGGMPESDADDYIDGDGTGVIGDGVAPTDEDDHDPALIQVVDVALAKTVATSGPYVYGQEVEFDIEVINQGNVDLENVTVSDYIPCGFSFGPINPGWNESGNVATYTIQSLDAYETVTISISLTVLPISGSCDYADAYVNYAEVSQMFADYDGDGVFDNDVSNDDIDSMADPFDDNDGGGEPNSDADDYVLGDGTGPTNDGTDITDEDDHDPAFISIFDLAQIKYINDLGPYDIGETATFVFEVTNQGNVDAYDIVITDYLADGYNFSTIGNDGWGTSGNNLEYTIDGPLAPGETETITLDLTVVLPVSPSAASWYNESEISDADDDTNPGNEDPTDADSMPDDNPNNDNDLDDGPDDDPIFDPDDENDNVIDENPNDPFGMGDDDEDDNDAAGIIVAGGIGDTVWKDEDGNGIQDDGEEGVEGVIVILRDCDGNILGTQTTGADGYYFFNSLSPGDYQVQFDISNLPPGCTFTQQDQGGDDRYDSDVDALGLSPCITIDAGEYNYTVDAGLYPLVNIGDFVWHDLDGDGFQDAGEPGIPDVMVLLYNDANELVQVTMTDEDGLYLFTNVFPDTYYIVFVDPDGFVSTQADQTDDEEDSDITNFVFTDEGSTTDLFEVVIGQGDDLSFDAGYYKCIPVGEWAWYDVDEDDIRDPNENGLNGLEVNLYRLNNFGSYVLFDTQITALKPGTPSDDGYFKFCAPPGTYYIEVVMPPIGLVKAKANAFNNLPLTHPNESTVDSDLTGAFGGSTTSAFTIESGEMLCNIGAGFYPMANAGNRVWFDANENGIQDSGEQSVANVLVEAYEVETGQKIAESTTDNSGTYMIEYLEKKDYYLKFSPPNGFGFTSPNIGDEDMDSDVDHSYGYKTTAAYSMEPGETYINIDAGLRFGGVLPLEWVSVEAEHREDHNLISWKTVAEVNTERFVIEKRSEDGQKFEAIGETDAQGDPASVNSYEFKDYDVRPGTYYYRIKQVDKDGVFDYSDIVQLKIVAEGNTITLAPNPAKGRSILSLELEGSKDVMVNVIGSDGRLIRTYTIDGSSNEGVNTQLEIDDLPTGVYSIFVQQGALTEVKKLIVIE